MKPPPIIIWGEQVQRRLGWVKGAHLVEAKRRLGQTAGLSATRRFESSALARVAHPCFVRNSSKWLCIIVADDNRLYRLVKVGEVTSRCDLVIRPLAKGSPWWGPA